MKRLIAFLLCAAVLSFGLMLTGCGCAGCGTDTDMNVPNNGASSGTVGTIDPNGTNSTNVTNGTAASNGTNATGDLTDDLRNGVDDLIDGAEGVLNDAENTIDGTIDGADTYGADRNTNLNDMDGHQTTRTTNHTNR